MRLLIITAVDAWSRSVATVARYAAAGRALGHDVVVWGHADPDLPGITFTTDLAGVDIALFVIQVTKDLPDMPDLARVIDTIPRERRIVVDLWGRCNDTIRLEHDFNHLEKLDGHAGWEWQEALHALAGRVCQPSLVPEKPDVASFLFHGFDPDQVVAPYDSAREAASAWRNAAPAQKPYGLMYVGNNWHRWVDMRRVLEAHAPLRAETGGACLVGWDWKRRPDWAVEMGLMGIDTDPDLLTGLGVDVMDGVRYDAVVGLLGKARFVPVLHRPLFRHLGFVTVRTFETFCADALPLLLLPRKQVRDILGEAALALVPEGDIATHMRDALRRPERYWEAVLETRQHLARHHSFSRRFQELAAIARESALMTQTGTGARR